MYSYKGFLPVSKGSSLLPFPTESQDPPPPALSLLVMVGRPDNPIGRSSGQLSQRVGRVSLPLPA